MGLTRFPHGVSSFGVPVMGAGSQIPATTGNYYFVDDSGSNGSDGLDPDHPVATLDYAIGLCTADHGDVIILMPGHAESATAIAADVAGITIIGLGYGEAMPTITGTTAAADLIDVTVDSVVMKNIMLVGGASGTSALVDATGDADYLRIEGCVLKSGAAAPVDLITLATGADNVSIVNNQFLGAGTELDNFILAEGYVANLLVQGNYFEAHTSDGTDEAFIQFAISGSGPVWIDSNGFFSSTDGDALVLQVSENDACMLISRNYGVVNDYTDVWVAITYAGAAFAGNLIAEIATRAAVGSAVIPATSAVA